MTTSDHKKVFKQLKVKPAKLSKYVKHNSPKKRSTGFGLKKCRRCGRMRAHMVFLSPIPVTMMYHGARPA